MSGILVAFGLLAVLCALTIITTLNYDKIQDVEEKIKMKLLTKIR